MFDSNIVLFYLIIQIAI